MSPGAVAEFLGGFLILSLVTGGLSKGLRRWLPAVASTIIASALSLAIATLIGAYGFADGGPPKFEHAFSSYVLPQMLILALLLFGGWKRRSGLAQQTEVEAVAPVKNVRTWPTTLVAWCVLAAVGTLVAYYGYSFSHGGISYTIGQAMGSAIGGLLLAWFMRRWLRERWAAVGILLASVALGASNIKVISDGYDAMEAKRLLAVTTSPSEIHLTARQHPSNRILQLTSAAVAKAEEAEKRTTELADSLEPSDLAKEPAPETASRTDLESYRALLTEAETRARSAIARHAAILAQERAEVTEVFRSRAPGTRDELLDATLKGIDRRHDLTRRLGEQLFNARADFYAAYGKVYDNLIAQHGRYRAQNGQFLFFDQAAADRWNASVADYQASAKRLQAVAAQVEKAQKSQLNRWKQAMEN